MINRMLPLAAALVLAAGVAACDGAEDEADFEMTDQEIVTEPTTETIEVEVPATDSMLVEREVDVDVDVDTTDID